MRRPAPSRLKRMSWWFGRRRVAAGVGKKARDAQGCKDQAARGTVALGLQLPSECEALVVRQNRDWIVVAPFLATLADQVQLVIGPQN